MGIHFCVGALLARKEMTIAYERLFTRLTDWRLTPGKNELRHIASILHRGLTGLHVSYRTR
jgi:cytochrome P450